MGFVACMLPVNITANAKQMQEVLSTHDVTCGNRELTHPIEEMLYTSRIDSVH